MNVNSVDKWMSHS